MVLKKLFYSMKMDIYDLIAKLRNDKLFTIKQLSHIQSIGFYISDLNVYKIVLVVYPNELKKAAKVGLKNQYTFFNRGFGKIKEPLEGTAKGRYILLYHPYNREIIVSEGEEGPNTVTKNKRNGSWLRG